MSKIGFPTSRVATPIKVWAPRFLFVALVALSLSLMVLDRYNARPIEQARGAVMDGVTPFLDLMSRPIDTIAKWMEAADELFFLRSEHARLKLENERLAMWQQAARRLEAENAALRELLRLTPQPADDYVTARAVGGSGGAYVRSLLINAGSNQGIGEGQAAVDGNGLAGRVLHVGRRSARVLLITDINSRIPVVVGSGRSSRCDTVPMAIELPRAFRGRWQTGTGTKRKRSSGARLSSPPTTRRPATITRAPTRTSGR